VALRVGAMTEALGLDADLGPQAFLRGIARILGLAPSAADDALELVGASPFAKKHIGKLSLGMRQRVRLALALMPDAPYLVLDEPQNGLDPDGIDWLYDFLGRERAAGRTLLVATHHLHEAERLADACVLLHRTVRYVGPATPGLSTLYHRFR
jgi:ABC-2 type transport system ATP-binding protein